MPRQWIIDIIHSIVPNDFDAFLKQRVDARDEARKNAKNLNIKLTQEALDAFKASGHVSVRFIFLTNHS
jgi:hypothetical protein